ncbi:hypothetical protein [uncultured Enterovirga sp.]|uniref:hypothetical protein n=1 Tax=uncultured Enterovirga sp. TaxID=2026352 RepID=UPI0035CB22AC
MSIIAKLLRPVRCPRVDSRTDHDTADQVKMLKRARVAALIREIAEPTSPRG